MIISKIKYYDTNELNVKNYGISVWFGIKTFEDKYIICGTTETNGQSQSALGIIYIGDIDCVKGQVNYLNVPNSISTSVYGPNYNKKNKLFNFVGSFVSQSNDIKGFVYIGKLTSGCKILSKPQNFIYPNVNDLYNTVYIHSIMNGMYVGNSGNIGENNTMSFLYNTCDDINYTEIKFPKSQTTTTYGIWYNGDDIYTVVGAYSLTKKLSIDNIYINGIPKPYDNNFIAFYNAKIKQFYNWTSINLPLGSGLNILSHITGIYGDCQGNYSLSIDVIDNNFKLSDKNNVSGGYYGVIVPYNNDLNNYQIQKFVNLNTKCVKFSSNSVASNCVVGLILDTNEPFQAKIIN